MCLPARVRLARTMRWAMVGSWKLYSVSFPNREKQEYDFVTMTELANFADLEAPNAGIGYAAIFGESKFKEMRGMASAVQKLSRNKTPWLSNCPPPIGPNRRIPVAGPGGRAVALVDHTWANLGKEDCFVDG
jgi:hypothetical protein